jgi:hypothetical protein
MGKFKGKMYNIHSSNVDKIGWEYDEENKTGVMRVQFKNGKTYDYFPVSKQKYDECWKEKSKGSWIQTELVKAPSVSYEEVTADE